MTSIMIKPRRATPIGAALAVLVLLFTSLGLMTPAQAAPPAVAPASSIVSIQSALVTTPERVMVPKAWRTAPTVLGRYVKDGWGGKWGTSCQHQKAPLNSTHWRVFEVRKNNFWFGTCTRTGYHYDVRDGSTVVIWVYN